tara:strand:+ start:1296 stop:2285 length:990 start_codon:yes stop_codon:yes gene_type:complete
MHRIFCISLILLICLPANARLRDYVNVAALSNRNLGTWSAGDGDRVWQSTHCVASSNYNNTYNDPPPVVSPAAVHEPYQFRITDTAAATGYHLYLDDDPSNTGNARIEATFEHRDIKVGTGYEVLSDGVYDTHGHTGQFKRCNNGDNSEIQMTLNETELVNARAGQYRGRFEAEATGGSSGTTTHSRNLVLRVTVAEIVRVSSLDNVLLGNWSGSGDMQGDETFCVYSNNDSAGYTIDFSSPNKSGNVFRLGNDTLTEFVEYDLVFADSALGTGTAVGRRTVSGTGSNSAADCGSVDNARISVNVSAASLGAATPDSYSDTITLLVAPL